MTGIRRDELPKTKHNGHVWGVYVRPAWRGLRIAEALIEACISWSKRNSICIVKLGVLKESGPAVRCYERCGFTIYGTEPRGIYFEGKYYDGLLMFRLLEDS